MGKAIEKAKVALGIQPKDESLLAQVDDAWSLTWKQASKEGHHAPRTGCMHAPCMRALGPAVRERSACMCALTQHAPLAMLLLQRLIGFGICVALGIGLSIVVRAGGKRGKCI
jgi:hypothetical protein